MQLVNLEDVRALMVEEIDLDVSHNRLYISSRLSPQRADAYPDLLRQAAISGTAATLAGRLRPLLLTHETRNLASGKTTTAKVPVTAAETLAEGEFNRFYIRGVCRLAIERGVREVEAYRAKPVTNPRPDSNAKIGTRYDAAKLLEDLRVHVGVDTALGLPSGPNSGLSVRLPSP